MKLPERKQKEFKDKGKPESRQIRGGGAMGRLRQFEKERGLDQTDLSNPAAEKAQKDKGKGKPAPKK